jgi:NAD(P)-dependent dehydrogenase (short-subunit alcohol dehydrogenase family)
VTQLENAAAVVTGHSRGIGAAIAEHLLTRRIPVVGVSRHRNVDLAKRFDDTLHQVHVDLADSEALTRWLRRDALRQFFDGHQTMLLVNNAGVLQPVGPLESQDASAISRAVTINVAAPLALSAAFVAVTAHARDRRILHISSGAARDAYAGWSVYCASKAALDHHARAVALDRTPGLRICSLAPGVIETAMQAEVRASSEAMFPDRERFMAMKREGGLKDPGDTGRAIVDFLLSDAFGESPIADLRESD